MATTNDPSAAPVVLSGTDRFALSELVAVRGIEIPGRGLAQRWRLVPSPDDPHRLVRVVDHVDPADPTHLLRQEIMLADSMIVAVPDDRTVAEIVALIRAAGYAVRPTHSRDAVIDVILPNPDLDSVPLALDDLSRALPGILIEPNFLHFSTNSVPSDYDSNEMWALNIIEAPAAWGFTTGSSEVVVAVIDTGIDWTHPDLAANMWINPGEIAGNGIDDDNNGFVDDINGWNFVDDNNNASDPEGHGTHVSGTIGAVGNNNQGVVGVNWNVRLIALRAGNIGFDTSDTVNAMRYVNDLRAAGVNVVVINASFGGSSFVQASFNEIQKLRNSGVLFVAAAGNDSADNDSNGIYPASYDLENIISVASITHSGALSSFSDYGATTVDIAAPGTAIRSTIPGGLYDYYSGTSMAAPHVTGAAALVASVNPSFNALQIKTRLLDSAQPSAALTGLVATGGRLNLRRAIAPATVPPVVAITTPSANVVAMEKPGLSLDLGASLIPEGGAMPTATFSWEKVDGPVAVSFSDSTSSRTTAAFSSAGVYRLRVNASSGGIVESDDVTVVVGDSSPTTSGLRAWWGFNESSGNAADSSGEGRTGVVNGAQHVSGVLGGGLKFDGTSTNVSFTVPSMQRMTITAWARADSAGNSIFPRIVNMQQGLFFFGLGGDTRDGNGDTLKFAIDNGFEDRVWHTSQGTIVTNRLYQVAVTYDATSPTNNPRFYIDGIPYGVGVQTGGGAPPVVPSTNGFLGDRGDGTRNWDGLIDEVRMYDRELSPGELAVISRENVIQALMGGTFGIFDVLDPLGARAQFSPAAVSISGVVSPSYEWSSNSPGLSIVSTAGTEVVARADAPGSYELRLDVDVPGRLHAVRTVPVIVNPVIVAPEGYYSGTTADGSSFVVTVDDGNNGIFLGGGTNRGRIGSGFTVSTYGAFEFNDAEGETVFGVVDPDGSINGLMNGSLSFTGTRQTSAGSGSPVPELDGFYRGWLLDSGTRISAVVADGAIAAIVESKGDIGVGQGDLGGSGTFSVSAGEATYSGSVGGARIDGTVAIGAQPARDFVLLREDFASIRRLASLSVRGPAGQGDNIMIAGFALEGAGSVPLLVRGIGPALEPFGVMDAIEAPRLTVLNGSAVLADSFGWDIAGVGEAAAVAAAAQRTGAFPLPAGAPDAALLSTQSEGTYTVHVSDAGGGTGTALAEVYDASEVSGGPTLVAVSSRSPVGTGSNIPIAGFSLKGNAPSLVLIRAVGPGLDGFGVSDALREPTISVIRDGQNIATAQAWGQGESLGNLTAISQSVGAFDLAPGSTDASVLLFLSPGLYTAQVGGVGGTQGIVLLEVYLVPDQ